jgi:hypothetical protein
MPRISIPFAGPANTLRSEIACPDEAINEVLESTAPGNAKTPTYSRNTPGLRVFCLLPTLPVRGIFASPVGGRVFAVAGATFYEIFAEGTFTALGSVANDTLPVSMDSNGSAGNQILIVSAGQGYIFNFATNTFSQITDPDFPSPARMVTFIGSYFVVLKGAGSRSFSWSAQEDGLSWDPLDVAEVSEASDNLNAVMRNHFELWMVGVSTSTVYVLTGDPTTVFAPYQGVLMELGTPARFTVQRIDNTLMWLTSDQRGMGMVVRMDQFVPRRISTFAVEWDIQQLSTAASPYTIGLAFQMEGHIFYALTFRDDDVIQGGIDHSWLYDVTMDRWTKWEHWNVNTATSEPNRAGCYGFCFEQHLFGDRLTGAIYRGSFAFAEEQLAAVA